MADYTIRKEVLIDLTDLTSAQVSYLLSALKDWTYDSLEELRPDIASLRNLLQNASTDSRAGSKDAY